MSNKTVYIAGDMLKKGSRILRDQEKKDIEELGYSVYSPMDDVEINDKQKQTEESNNKLAEKIVYKDTMGILQSDIIVIEPTNDACGTMVELGQIKGAKDMAKIVATAIMDMTIEKRDDKFIILQVMRLCQDMFDKKIYPHYEDCRRTDIPEKSDRRSWGVNQYVYGTCLDLSRGKGFYEWDEILDILKKDLEV